MATKMTITFFFSSRGRHTRSYGDWSSDVCSSDLSTDGPGSRFPELSRRTSSCRGGPGPSLGPLDGELTEGEADVHPAPLPHQGQGDLSLRHGLGVGRLAGPGVRLRLDVRPKYLFEVPCAGEPAGAADDFGLSKCNTAARGLDPDPGLLAVVAGDRAGPLGRLVEGGPALEVECHLALDQCVARFLRLVCGEQTAGGTGREHERAHQPGSEDRFGLHVIPRGRGSPLRGPL